MAVKIGKRLIPIIAATATLYSATLAVADALAIRPGEKRIVIVEVTEDDNQAFTLQSGVFWVNDQDGSFVQESAAATITGDTLSGLVNATSWTSGSDYKAYFQCGIVESPTEVFVWPVDIECNRDGI